MWAMIPMLRVLSSAYCRSNASSSAFSAIREMRRGGSGCAPLFVDVWLPAIMRERFVGLRHLVRVFSFLHGRAAVARRVEQLGGQLVGHAPLGPPAGGADDPPHGQPRPPVG